VLAPRQSRRIAQRKTNGTGIVELSAHAIRFPRAHLSLRAWSSASSAIIARASTGLVNQARELRSEDAELSRRGLLAEGSARVLTLRYSPSSSGAAGYCMLGHPVDRERVVQPRDTPRC